jgi:hypothetical protein
MSMSAGGATVAADGSWRMRSIAPGEYRLEVSSQERERPPARAFLTLFVQGADIEGLSLVADTGGTITGQIVTDTGEALPTAPVRMRVVAESIAPDQRGSAFLVGDENGVASADGRFTFTRALGPSVLRVQGLPRGWGIKSVEADGGDLAESPLEVRGGQTVDARIVITSRFPPVSGRVTDDKGNPSEGSVLLFPADATKWFDTGVLRITRPDQTGLFRFENVRPGEYLAVALDVVESWQANDPEFLEELRSTATSVTVREGQPLQLVLTIR